jgi:hypothetical protein
MRTKRTETEIGTGTGTVITTTGIVTIEEEETHIEASVDVLTLLIDVPHRLRVTLPTNEPVQTPPPENEKLKSKRAKLEAWKREREAKKALDEAKAKAMALAGKSVPGEFCIHWHTRHDFTPLDPLHSAGLCFCYWKARRSTEPVCPWWS